MKRLLLIVLPLLLIVGCEDKKEEDTTPPTVTITSPQTNSTVSEIVTITCMSSDNEVVEKVRNGNGPALIEATTFRFQGHSMADPAKYRESSEVDEWKKKDPVEAFPNYILSKKIATQEEIDEIKKLVSEEMVSAVKFATDSNEPDLNSLGKDVYL